MAEALPTRAVPAPRKVKIYDSLEKRFDDFVVQKLKGSSYQDSLPIFQPNKPRSRMLQFLWDLPEFKDEKIKMVPAQKCPEISANYRIKSKDYYKRNDLISAIYSCNKSICYASNGTDLAVAFGLRSRYLLEMSQYKRAILDIDRALNAGSMTEIDREMLRERKRKCQQALNDEESKELWYSMQNLTVRTSPAPEDAPKVDIRVLPSHLDLFHHDYVKMPTIQDPNPKIPGLIASATISYTKDQGRGIFATKDIRPGEIIAVEDALGFAALDARHLCYKCGIRTLNLLPCDRCPTVVFCSSKCKEAAEEVHKIECPIWLSLLNVDSGNLISITKILAKAPFIETKDSFSNYEQDTTTMGVADLGKDSDGNYLTGNMRALYHLNSLGDKLSGTALMYRAYQSLLLMQLIASGTEYLGPKRNIKIGEDLLEGDLLDLSLMIFHLILLYQNGFVHSYEAKKGKESETYSFMMNTLIPLVNHSCFPNSFYSDFGSTLVVRASNFIKAGNEIVAFYGQSMWSTSISIEERRKFLRDVHCFTCKCVMCSSGLTPDDYEKAAIQLKCQTCFSDLDRTVGCRKCGTNSFEIPKIVDPNIDGPISTSRAHNLYLEKLKSMRKTEQFTTVFTSKELENLKDLIVAVYDATQGEPCVGVQYLQFMLLNNYFFRGYKAKLGFSLYTDPTQYAKLFD